MCSPIFSRRSHLTADLIHSLVVHVCATVTYLKQIGVLEFSCCLGGLAKRAGPRRENGSFFGREDKSPWKEFATEEDGWYPGRKRRFSFLVSPAKRRYISRSLVVRTSTNRTTYRWPVLILVVHVCATVTYLKHIGILEFCCCLGSPAKRAGLRRENVPS